ncbi:MAG: ECF transporter S component [Clostridiales bacterium]|nr:ECF transporter S component [Clostridiales bacterium]
MNKARFLTRTGLLLAVAIAFQLLGRFLGPYNNFIVGPVINAVLIIATAAAGIWSGIAIAVIAPLISAFTNKAAIAPVILAFSPFIISGNIILVLSYFFLARKNKYAAIATGAVLKFGFLFGAIMIFTSLMKLNPKITATLVALFSWPQLVTALIGGAIAIVVIRLAGSQFNNPQ